MSEREWEGQACRGWLGGALFGALVGSALCLVFTPKRGGEVREDLKKAVHKVSETVESLGQTVREQTEKITARLKRESQDTLQTWEEQKDHLQALIEEKVRQGADLRDAILAATDELFENMGQSAGELKEKVKSAAKDVAEKAQDKAQAVKEVAKETAEKVKEGFDKVKDA